jgi:hypothetical protein
MWCSSWNQIIGLIKGELLTKFDGSYELIIVSLDGLLVALCDQHGNIYICNLMTNELVNNFQEFQQISYLLFISTDKLLHNVQL